MSAQFVQFVALLVAALGQAQAAQSRPAGRIGTQLCGLNGLVDEAGRCRCDSGWRGSTCSRLNLAPASPDAYGLNNAATPTWGGGAVFEDGHWHLIVGARAVAFANDSATDYPCDSKIVRAVSAGANASGPYTVEETLFERSTWEPSLAFGPGGELLLMFFGNMSSPPQPGTPACIIGNKVYNLTNTNTYVAVSASGSAKGPWSEPRLAKGMENSPSSRGYHHDGRDPYSWSCASGNPSPAWHPNGTLFAAMRQNPCWKGKQTREHIGLWRADDGWQGEWRLVSREPLYGWGGGSESNCSDQNACPSHEDPHLWWDERGAHLLTHSQNNHQVHSTRGAYGWSLDGLSWTLETGPLLSNASAWDMGLAWSNGSSTRLARRQRASLVLDPRTKKPTHLINGADFAHHPGLTCDGCHWGSGMTLIQPLVQ